MHRWSLASQLSCCLLAAGAALAQGAPPPAGGFAAPTTNQMKVGIFQKLQYDLDYFSGVLSLQAAGKREAKLSKEDWDKEVRRSKINVPILKKLFAERAAFDARGQSLTLPPRDDAHRVYANLIALLNMLQAYDRGDFPRVLAMGERVVVTSKTDLGVVRSDDAKYYLNLYREYFWFMAAAHYRMGNDREAVAWLSRIDSDVNVQELKKQIANVNTRTTAERLSALYSKSIAIIPLVDRAPTKETDWVGNGFAEVFVTDLQRYTNLTIVERSNVEKVLKEVALSQAGITDDKNAKKAAQALAAGSLIRGVYEVKGAQVDLALELVDGDTGAVLARSAGAKPKDAMFGGGREVLLGLLRDAGWLSEDSADELRAARSPSPDTIRSLLEARLLLASKSEQAKELYKKAMKESPEYAKAFEDMQRQFQGVNPLVAVMNFVNVSGREEDQWMAYGAAESLNTDLPQIGFTLVERTQLAKVLKEQMLGQVLEAKEAQGLARQLGADFVVLGSVMVMSGQVRTDCRFVDVTTGVVVQTFSASGKLEEFGPVMARLAAEIARRFNVKLSDEDLKKLAGNRLNKDEFERLARERLLQERLVREKVREEESAKEVAASRAPYFVAGAGVVAGAAAAVTGFLMSSRAAADTAYIEGLQNFARRPEDVAALEGQRAQSQTAQTVWTVVGVAGVTVGAGSAAYMLYKLFTAPPPAQQKVEVAKGALTVVPEVLVAPGHVGVGVHGTF